MAGAKYDCFLGRVLRQSHEEFAFITSDYPYALPNELFWVMVRALTTEKRLTVRQAAHVVLDYCERRGDEIPQILNSIEMGEEDTEAEDLLVWH